MPKLSLWWAAFAVLAMFSIFLDEHGTAAPAQNREKALGTSQLHFSTSSGFHASAFDLSIEARSEGQRIWWTTNGTVPNPANAIEYRQPILIQTTTVIRAASFAGEERLGPVETRTFIFPRDVLAQTGAGFPGTWGTNEGQPVPADYEMDPEIVSDPVYRTDLEAGLKAIPTLALAFDLADVFDPSRGIYSNPKQSGSEWERPVTIQMFDTNGVSIWQASGGARIQGGWNRRPEESPKHAFRLVFRKKYGEGKLKFPLFGTAPPDEFDELILRAGCNNSWLHWSGEERRRGDYLRDQWMRDSYRAMGHASARGLFMHLYLNGLYWGVYSLTERPAAEFASAHFGGKAKDYDARNGANVLEGDTAAWDRMLALANGGLAGAHEYTAISELLDLSAFADFMILNLFGSNADWDRASNWYAARRRTREGRFQFFVWDGERTLENKDANSIAFDDDQSPPRLFHKLRENPEFRLLFADRVQRHLFGQGVLTPTNSAERFRRLSEVLDQPIVAESARWGDYRRDVHRYKVGSYELYTRNDHWRPETKRLLAEYFPTRSKIAVEQFQAAGLYPRLDAPEVVPSGSVVELRAGQSTIYFTTDGSDPRRPGGPVAPQARQYTRPFALSEVPSGRGRARALKVTRDMSEWSALVEF